MASGVGPLPAHMGLTSSCVQWLLTTHNLARVANLTGSLPVNTMSRGSARENPPPNIVRSRVESDHPIFQLPPISIAAYVVSGIHFTESLEGTPTDIRILLNLP